MAEIIRQAISKILDAGPRVSSVPVRSGQRARTAAAGEAPTGPERAARAQARETGPPGESRSRCPESRPKAQKAETVLGPASGARPARTTYRGVPHRMSLRRTGLQKMGSSTAPPRPAQSTYGCVAASTGAATGEHQSAKSWPSDTYPNPPVRPIHGAVLAYHHRCGTDLSAYIITCHIFIL